MSSLDMNQLMSMLSKMDKKDLERGLAQASQLLNTTNKEDLLKQFSNGMKKQ